MDNPQLTHPQASRAKKFSWVKKLMNNTNINNNKVSTNNSSVSPITSTTTPALKVSKSSTPISKNLHFGDINSLDNDQMSFISTTPSNYSSTLRNNEIQQRLFYTRNHLIEDSRDLHSNDLETNSSIKSLYSANFPASIYSNNTTKSKYSKNYLQSQNMVSINSQLYSHMSNNQSSSINTYNASMINNVDVTSTISDSFMDDNISTKPILSISSDEEDNNDDMNDDISNIPDEIKSIKFQYDDYALPNDEKYDNDNEIVDDDISFDMRSRYPPSHGSTAITSMSIISPLLTTINSQTTTQTNTNATAASVMTLASSSRNVAI
ncbi:hypothetical protein CANINC_000268 [Pichia inconspicua]|uniref:Uncharacterized protein n=1 Tax=Pichia inconspicua TaxID=52247 RepID=A0A4V4NGA0_9ASCO|nr:hypothetical protein CANINC_000268 [[Candida] inconspicua]